MSVFSHFSLQKAIYQRLTGDATLMGMVTGVYDKVPDDADFPYIAIGNFTGVDWSSKTTSGMEYNMNLHVWSREGGRAETTNIMQQVFLLLHDADIEVEEQELVMIRFQSSNILLESDGWSYQGILRFRVLLQAI